MSAVLITALAFSVSAANVNKYDWNKTVKWRMNKKGKPVDVCYNYKKGSINYRECQKKAKKIFAQRCRYGKKNYCGNKMRRSSSNRLTNVRKTGRGAVILE